MCLGSRRAVADSSHFKETREFESIDGWGSAKMIGGIQFSAA